MERKIKEYLDRKQEKNVKEYRLLSLLASGLSIASIMEYEPDMGSLIETIDHKVNRK